MSVHIDSHQHYWRYNNEEFPWITDDIKVIKRDFHANDLKPLLKNHGMYGSIAIQARLTEDENDYLLKMSDECPDVIRGVVGWVDLTKSDVKTSLEKWSKHPKFVGVRHIVQDEPDDNYLLREDFLHGISLLKQFNLTYDILIFHRHLKVAIEFVKKFPDQAFVLDHIAKPDIKNHVMEPWATDIKKLSEYKNLYCKISGMVTEANKDEPYESFVPYLDVIFNSFGVDRIMFGSDWPVCTINMDYSGVHSMIQRYISKYTKEEQDKILGLNAIKFYNIKI
uniref:Amidohydrolase family protein n=1 Tax=Opalinidae sp. TaxID=2059444 RepID=A0A649UYW8_9STRA|nr:amidohydrolase family protein [Opalinidae sp.]